MKKRRNAHRVASAVRAMLPFLLLAVALDLGGIQALAAKGASSPVRLSYVEGSVQLLDGDHVQFPEAAVNMPVVEGNEIVTGGDGRAEIEFPDGSVARLTPNSSLRLIRLRESDGRLAAAELEQVSGLGYFELNVSEGQRFTVRFAGATARPTDNSIFRINLDSAPELGVMEGGLRLNGGGAFDIRLPQDQSIHLDPHSLGNYSLADGVKPDTWDRWNADRDHQISEESEKQTGARDSSGNSSDPGWNDLDANGDWYPVEGYGNVWVPEGVDAGWDPFGYGAWGNYPGYGYTWISGYSWGWLPYHCGAWNYFDTFGWGWIPGECGLGWTPFAAVWNVPPGYRIPPRPIPGGHIGGGPFGNLTRVDRGPRATGPWGKGRPFGQPEQAHSIHIDGKTIQPLPRTRVTALGVQALGVQALGVQEGHAVTGTGHVGVPVHTAGSPVGVTHRGLEETGSQGLVTGVPYTVGAPVHVGGPPAYSPMPTPPPRPVYAPPPAQPRVYTPAQPRASAPASAPRVVAPAPASSAHPH